LVPPHPFDLRRFRPGPSGFRLLPPPPALTPAALLSSRCPSPRSLRPLFNRTHQRYGECTSPGVPPPTAFDSSWRPYDPGVPPPGTVRPRGFAPPRRLASPETMRSLFHPRYAHGVPPSPAARLHLSVQAGLTLPGFLSKALPPPVTATSSVAHLSRASSAPDAGDAHAPRSPDDCKEGGEASTTNRRAPQSLRSRKVRHFPRWRTASAGLLEVCG